MTHVGVIGPFHLFRLALPLNEVNAFAAPANAPSEMQLGNSGCPRSFVVHYNPRLCGSQQGARLSVLSYEPSFMYLTAHAGYCTSGQRSNKRKVSVTNVAAKSMHELPA